MTSDEARGRTEAEATVSTSAIDSERSGPDAEWSHTAAESHLLGALVAVSLGVVAALTLGVVVAAAVFAVGSFLSGEFAVAIAILSALLLAAARFGPHFTAFRRESAARSSPLYEAVRRMGWPGLAAASLFGLGVLSVGLELGGVGFFVVVFGSIAAPMVAVSALTSEGELDAASGTLTYCGTEVDLSALADSRRLAFGGFRRFGFGGLVVYRLSYVSGAMTPSTPRFVVVPASTDEPVWDAIEAGVAAESEEYDPTNRTIRVTLAAFGVGLLAFAGVLLTVEPTSPNPRGGIVLVYAALLFGLFGAIFLSLAARSG